MACTKTKFAKKQKTHLCIISMSNKSKYTEFESLMNVQDISNTFMGYLSAYTTNNFTSAFPRYKAYHGSSDAINEQDMYTGFGVLIRELAFLDNQSSDEPQTCPLCSDGVSLKQFPEHVLLCLDGMDVDELDELRSHYEPVSDSPDNDFGFKCPVCNAQLSLGMSINAHVNQCLDNKSKVDEMRMNREQMIECASKLLTLKQGSELFENMLEMFAALGFNEVNVKSILEEKQVDKMVIFDDDDL